MKDITYFHWRSYRVTKVSVLGGDDTANHPLLNLEVRVGDTDKHQADANTKFSDNTR